MQNKAPRTEQTRFISSWHAQSELQGQVRLSKCQLTVV
jgi:hypothetical protein